VGLNSSRLTGLWGCRLVKGSISPLFLLLLLGILLSIFFLQNILNGFYTLLFASRDFAISLVAKRIFNKNTALTALMILLFQ